MGFIRNGRTFDDISKHSLYANKLPEVIVQLWAECGFFHISQCVSAYMCVPNDCFKMYSPQKNKCILVCYMFLEKVTVT